MQFVDECSFLLNAVSILMQFVDECSFF